MKFLNKHLFVAHRPNFCCKYAQGRGVMLPSSTNSRRLKRPQLTRTRARRSVNPKFDPTKWFLHQSYVFNTSSALTCLIGSRSGLVCLHAFVIRSHMDEPRGEKNRSKKAHWRLQYQVWESVSWIPLRRRRMCISALLGVKARIIYCCSLMFSNNGCCLTCLHE